MKEMSINEKCWTEIERKYLGQCYWQANLGRMLVECLHHNKLKGPVIVTKMYDGTVPPRRGKPWPMFVGNLCLCSARSEHDMGGTG